MKKILISCLVIIYLFIFVSSECIKADNVDDQVELVMNTVTQFIEAFENEDVDSIKTILSSDFVMLDEGNTLNKDVYIGLLQDVLESGLDYHYLTISDLAVEQISDGEYKILGELEISMTDEPVTIVSSLFKVKKINDIYYISEFSTYNAVAK